MQVYTNTDLTGATIPPRQVTVGSKTVGCIITNYSNIGFNLNTDSNANLGTLPPYFSMNVSVNPGDVIYFNETSIATSALPQPSMFVTLAESQQPLSAGVTALAIVPGYQLTTTGTVSFAPGQEVAIQGTPEVNLASGTQVEINNAQIPATVVNASLTAFSTYAIPAKTIAISNLAPGAGVGIMLSLPAGFYDNVSFDIVSANGLNNNYEFNLSQQRYGSSLGNRACFLSPGTILTLISGEVTDNYDYEFLSGTTILNQDFCTNLLYIYIENISSATIAADTVTIAGYIKFSSQTVTNPALNSLKQTSFSYNWSEDSTGVVTGNLPNNVNILAAGGDIYTVVVDLSGTGGYSLSNGGSTFASGGTTQKDVHNTYPFSSGVPNNGINITGGSGGPSTAAALSGYVIHS